MRCDISQTFHPRSIRQYYSLDFGVMGCGAEKVTGFVVINPLVLSANRVDLGFIFFIIFLILLPPPQMSRGFAISTSDQYICCAGADGIVRLGGSRFCFCVLVIWLWSSFNAGCSCYCFCFFLVLDWHNDVKWHGGVRLGLPCGPKKIQTRLKNPFLQNL